MFRMSVPAEVKRERERRVAENPDAAQAASSALPAARSNLEAAHAEATRMENERLVAVTNALKVEANRTAGSRYARLWRELCECHDEIVGISGALPPAGPREPEVRMTHAALEVPRFNLLACADANEYLAVMRHLPSEATVATATARWSEARSRLLADASASIDDLIDAEVAA